MKKLTAIFPDDANIKLTDIITQSVYFCLQEEPKGKHEKKLTPGRTVDATLEYFQGERKGHKEPKRKIIPGRTVASTIMEHFKPGGTFSAAAATRWVAKQSYGVSSASSQLPQLVEKGYLKKISRGRYQFLKPPPWFKK